MALEEYNKMKFKTECRMNVLKMRTQNLETDLLSIETEFNKVSEELTTLEYEKALGLRISGTGRRLSGDETKKMIEKKKKRSLEMTQVRITYIQYQNILKNINNKLCKLESLGVGLTTKYYGKLLRHKQSLMDRVEEQRENIRKLQKIYFTYPAVSFKLYCGLFYVRLNRNGLQFFLTLKIFTGKIILFFNFIYG